MTTPSGTPSGTPMPTGTPSGIPISFQYINRVGNDEFDAATDALDRALLRKIGLPEDVDVLQFEAAVFNIINKIDSLIRNFTLSTSIWIIPEIIEDGIALYDKMKPTIEGKIERNEFISRVIVYAYKKHDPDLPVLVEPFETMVENLILGAVPSLVTSGQDGLADILQGWIDRLTRFFR